MAINNNVLQQNLTGSLNLSLEKPLTKISDPPSELIKKSDLVKAPRILPMFLDSLEQNDFKELWDATEAITPVRVPLIKTISDITGEVFATELKVQEEIPTTNSLVVVKNNQTQPIFWREQTILPWDKSQRQNRLELSANEFTSNLSTFKINIIPGANLLAQPLALAAFQRAAAQWERQISDPVTVYIHADLAPLPNGVLGQASSISLQTSYSNLRNAMVNDAESDDGIVQSLPINPSYLLPPGVSASSNLAGTKANLKALGYTTLDSLFGTKDGQITFSSNFAFDYDDSNGITKGQFSFETIAVHEIGHVLGFTSAVDQVDRGATFVTPRTLDLFRFQNNFPGRDPSNPFQFATFPRSLTPGVNAIFDQINSWRDTNPEYLFSTGINMGDGRQASHWKDNRNIGVMDPTLRAGEVVPISNADWRALDLIGWDISEQNNNNDNDDPEPPILYFSVKNNGTVGGIPVSDEDIVSFDGTDFEVFWDGSAVDSSFSGLEIDAFHLLSEEEILISFTTAATIDGSLIDDSDIVKFTKLNGSYSSELYFDGSDVGLTSGGEDIDALSLLPNGDLLISTVGNLFVSNLFGGDEDIIKFTPTKLGATTRGSWSTYFDGSDVGLFSNSEDVDAVGLKDGEIFLSTIGNFSVSGASGRDEDVVNFDPSSLGSSTSGVYDPTLFFDGSIHGIGGNDISAIYLPS